MAAHEAERLIRALQLAKECADLGARVGTISEVTGLRPSMLRTYFFRHGGSTNGRRPESSDWIHWGNLCMKAEASEFASIFSRLLDEHRCAPADALVAAYRMYAQRCSRRPVLSFDRAFSLVSDLRGIWMRTEQRLAMYRCPKCQARYVAEVGAPSPGGVGCVFCHLLLRYRLDPRLQAHFAGRCAGQLESAGEVGADPERDA